MSRADQPDRLGSADDKARAEPSLRIEVVRGGDPGPDVLAALAAVLTRPVVVAVAGEDAGHERPAPPRNWVRAARLEAVSAGRRIPTVADLVHHR